MKIKDIEDILKKEHDQASVPDVYTRVKKAPINRLLSPPTQVFKKKLAIQLLVVAFVLLLAVVFTLVTMWSVPQTAKNDVSYVSISVESGDTVVRYGLFVEGTIVSLASKESEGEVAVFEKANVVGLDIESAIQTLYIAKDGDKVRFCVICDDLHSETRVSELVLSALYFATAQCDDCLASENKGDGQDKQVLIGLLQQKGIQTTASLDALYTAYAQVLS